MSTDTLSAESWRDYWQILQDTQAAVEAVLMARVGEIPAFARLVAQMDPEQRAQQEVRSQALQRAAMLEGEWQPYLADLRGQGGTYAMMGVTIGDWYALSVAFRPVVREALMRRFIDDLPRLNAALSAMDLATDRAMEAIAGGYVETYAMLQRSAEEDREIYVDIVRNAPLGIQVLLCEREDDPGSFRLVAANPASSAQSGADSELNIGKTLREIAPALMETPVPERYAESLRVGEPRSWEITYGDDRTSERTYAARCFPLPRKHLAVMFEDISERRRSQLLLERSMAELERSNQELDSFAYIASHDLKSPLRDVDNLATWIAEDAKGLLPEESQQDLDKLRQRVRRMERLLDDLLDYSRAGRLLEEPTHFDMVDALQIAIEQAAVPEAFQVTLRCDPLELATPRTPLEQVVRNLVTNAYKHHDRAAGEILVSAVRRGDRVELTVGDDGPGIPAEHHERCFQMFQTLRPRDEVEGTGVGLPLVEKVITSYGGSMALESEGRGCTFRFSWPLAWTPEGT